MELLPLVNQTIAAGFSHHREPRRPASWTPIRFDRIEVMPASRTVLRDGMPIKLGGRAFDLLMVLLRSAGEVVSKDAIVGYVWPTTTVEETNLRVQVAVLRKALGNAGQRIKTIAGRGYLFAAECGDGARTAHAYPCTVRALPAPRQSVTSIRCSFSQARTEPVG